MKDTCKYTGKRVLLVEGNDDCHVIMALCKHYDVPETFGIYRCDSDNAVLKRLNALALQPDPPEVVGIVLDADSSGVMKRFRQVQKKIKNYEYSFPSEPQPDGTIIKGKEGMPDIGMWFMPDNREPGALEDFLLSMADQKTLDAAGECIDKANDTGVAKFKDVHRSKALIHTYLAWQNEPGRPLGQSITAHTLQPDTAPAKAFVKWLEKLFCY